MLPFTIALRAGDPPARQIAYAATRAIVSGELAPGAAFPSVRELSQALKVNPNTVQKVVAELTRDGLLEVRPGIGTIVATGRRATAAERRKLLSGDVEQLIVEAKRLGLGRDDVTEAVRVQWDALFEADAGRRRR